MAQHVTAYRQAWQPVYNPGESHMREETINSYKCTPHMHHDIPTPNTHNK